MVLPVKVKVLHYYQWFRLEVALQCVYQLFDFSFGTSGARRLRSTAYVLPTLTLLSVPGKVYATVLDKRIGAITEGKVLEEQGAFRSKRSCIDQIFTVRQLGEKVLAKNKTMRMVCVDLEKAFDRVDRELLWQVFREIWCQG